MVHHQADFTSSTYIYRSFVSFLQLVERQRSSGSMSFTPTPFISSEWLWAAAAAVEEEAFSNCGMARGAWRFWVNFEARCGWHGQFSYNEEKRLTYSIPVYFARSEYLDEVCTSVPDKRETAPLRVRGPLHELKGWLMIVSRRGKETPLSWRAPRFSPYR